MNKTKVDDMLLEMITPRLKEIEERFSGGQGLTQDDVNTLLLKSQYNHINHLDVRLDEVAASVAVLEGKFQTFAAEIRVDFEKAQVKMQETIISTMRWYIGGAGVVLVLIKALDVFVKH
ncbi:MAG: hypothetical protein WC091_19940 [Sulfuricellaceae bacterium]